MTGGTPAWLAAIGAVALGLASSGSDVHARPDVVTARVIVTVGDAAAPVVNLTADDFDVWSDGARLAVAQVTAEPEPLSLLLLIDASFSALEVWDLSSDSLTAYVPSIESGIVPNLAPGDRLSLGVFGRRTQIGRFAADPESIQALERGTLAMDIHERYGPSPIWDAVEAASTALAPRPGRRGIVLLTDGKATGNHHGLAQVIDRAMQADVAVSIVGRGGFLLPPDPTANAPWVNLKRLADATGGTFADRGALSLDLTLARMIGQFHRTYTIAFSPGAAGAGAHRLQVHVKKAGAQAHVREQYWVTPAER